jgi:hypothetical protein
MKQNSYRLDNPLDRFQSTTLPPSAKTSNHVPPKRKGKDPSFAITVKTVGSRYQSLKVPSLPKVQTVMDLPESLGVDPTPAMNLLKEIEATLMGWQQELRQVVQQIQGIYAEGPILDGWLESQEQADQGEFQGQRVGRDYGDSRFRDFGYVEEIHEENISYQTPRTGYHLCGFDEQGQPWSRPCPPEQVAQVSVAIARYQKICELLNHKSTLEQHLNQLAETLAVVHQNLLD